MSTDILRIKAVVAALRAVRDEVAKNDAEEEWSTSAFDKWIRLLNDTCGIDADELTLDEADMPRAEFLVHLEAAIAFLDVYEFSGV